MRNAAITTLAATIVLLLAAAPASASASSSISAYSQQRTPSRATAGASVEASSRSPGTPAASTGAPPSYYRPASSSTPTPVEPSPPARSAPVETGSTGEPGSTFATTSVPYGGWVCDEGGNRVVCAIQVTSPPRPRRVAKGAGAAEPSRPAVSPAALAAAAASRVSLTVGSIEASPAASADGLTGAASWFWISPAPATRTVSVSLAGERVTVSATVSSVQWSFGDGTGLTGGPGVAYRPGNVPAGAVRHVYETRCLPGDQGHDPYVLPSCGADGYTVTAVVQWSIAYTASGPVSTGGALPSRSTTTSVAYPVSESRAFLTTAKGEG
jgi:hypothetical protein